MCLLMVAPSFPGSKTPIFPHQPLWDTISFGVKILGKYKVQRMNIQGGFFYWSALKKRAVSRKTPTYFIYITIEVCLELNMKVIFAEYNHLCYSGGHN